MKRPPRTLTPGCPKCSFVTEACPVLRPPAKDCSCKYFAHRSLGRESRDYHRRQMIADGLTSEDK